MIIEELADLIVKDLAVQKDAYVDGDDIHAVVIDGTFDLIPLARKIYVRLAQLSQEGNL